MDGITMGMVMLWGTLMLVGLIFGTIKCCLIISEICQKDDDRQPTTRITRAQNSNQQSTTYSNFVRGHPVLSSDTSLLSRVRRSFRRPPRYSLHAPDGHTITASTLVAEPLTSRDVINPDRRTSMRRVIYSYDAATGTYMQKTIDLNKCPEPYPESSGTSSIYSSFRSAAPPPSTTSATSPPPAYDDIDRDKRIVTDV